MDSWLIIIVMFDSGIIRLHPYKYYVILELLYYNTRKRINMTTRKDGLLNSLNNRYNRIYNQQ